MDSLWEVQFERLDRDLIGYSPPKVLSLENSLRSGGIHDPLDLTQYEELADNIQLARHAREAGVQATIEWSGGYIWAEMIADNVRYYKGRSELPLFESGSLPVDNAVSHHHNHGYVGACLAPGHGTVYVRGVLCHKTHGPDNQRNPFFKS
ncbi:MAG: phosphomethylpyrimidine synthase ThiC [Methanobacteriota archaeon]